MIKGAGRHRDFGYSKTREDANTMGIAMASEDLSDGRPTYVRFLLLLLGEAVAGVFFYGVFTFMPTEVQMIIGLACWGVIAGDNILHPKSNKSLGSLLCAITAIPVVVCGVEWRITHEDIWSRLMMTGFCLMAVLIFLDRRADD